ncbi:MAG: aldo/keto reductase [Brevinematales bacterium]|jgi:predicted aldo/keto reductase-like oxidoreductase
MKYRNCGKIDFKPSALGFGCMRLPMDKGKIEETEAIRMIRYAIDHGVNYVDTAYVYHNGESEIVTGKALKNGYREKVMLATKSPIWEIGKADDFDRLLETQLKKLQTSKIDFYLLHALGKDSWEKVKRLGILKKAEAARKDGRIGHIGFSFHDNYKSFEEIINGYDGWEFCQIQYNYMDTENQAGTKGLKLASSKGLAVIVMEPILGGRLANPPAAVRELMEGYSNKRSPVDWALQWIWNQPEVSLVLSGMSSFKQVEENIISAENSGINTLNGRDLSLIDDINARFRERAPVPCTKCGYCMPCPSGVNIPRNFEIYNDGIAYDAMNGAKFAYKSFMPENENASNCTQCRTCEEKCPQKIIISELMPKVHAALI